jgi:RNA polymerase sigma factor (sigma-70 family)
VGYCTRILRNSDDAEDVWQDAYLPIQRNIEQIDKFPPYLFRCLSNGCYKKLHDKKTEALRIESAVASGYGYATSAQAASAPPTPMELEEFQAEARLVLVIILSRRSNEQVWALNLRFYRGTGLKQVAEDTGRAVSTLSSWCRAFREERETELLKRGLLQGHMR